MFSPDIPFARDDANRFLPWMVGLMCGLAALMLCVGVTLNRWVVMEHTGASGSFVIQIPEHGERKPQLLRQVANALEKAPGVKSAKTMSESEVAGLIAPWIGNNAMLGELPLPTVIEVYNDGPVNYPQLAQQMRAISPDISVDTREAWADKFARFSQVTQAIIVALAICIVGALAGMMVFTTRAALKLHSETVFLLHSIGADDAYITRQFQTNGLAMALRGSVPGAVAAGGLYFLIGTFVERLDAPLLPNLRFSMEHAVLLLLLPLACSLISMAAVRFATLAQLRQLP